MNKKELVGLVAGLLILAGIMLSAIFFPQWTKAINPGDMQGHLKHVNPHLENTPTMVTHIPVRGNCEIYSKAC